MNVSTKQRRGRICIIAPNTFSEAKLAVKVVSERINTVRTWDAYCANYTVSVVKSSYSDDEERLWKLMQVRSHGERSWETFLVTASRQSAWNIHQNASARLYNEPDVNTLRVNVDQMQRQTNQQIDRHTAILHVECRLLRCMAKWPFRNFSRYSVVPTSAMECM